MSDSPGINIVLVVDDEDDMQTMIKQEFRKAIRNKEVQLFFAGDGEEALKILEGNDNIQIVYTDINMPRMDGLTLLTKIKERDSNIRVVIVSAYGDSENIRTAMQSGAYDFLTKPIDLDLFRRTFKRIEKSIALENSIGKLKNVIKKEPGSDTR
jgi:DNA-binding NtrC family response regulator